MVYYLSNFWAVVLPKEVIRSTEEEKEYQIKMVQDLQARHEAVARERLSQLQQAALRNENIFSEIMEAAKYCSLGTITNALYEVGGQYRRNM